MNIAYIITAAIFMVYVLLDFLGACIVALWHDEYEHHLKKKEDELKKNEPRQDEQR